MLSELSIKNIALIDEVEINFGSGLNILSGETGAGKSMVIEAINLALGERASKDILRTGASQAKVTALFYFDDEEMLSYLREMDIEIEEDHAVVITRIINATGKTSCKINGETVTIGTLKKLTDAFVDLHGQYEHQSLLNPIKHITLLDKFCGPKLQPLLDKMGKAYKQYKIVTKRLLELSTNANDREQKIEFLTFQLNEIENAKLQPEEEEGLLNRKKTLLGVEKLLTGMHQLLENLYDGSSMNSSALDKVNDSIEIIASLAEIDASLNTYDERLSGISAELDDITRELRHYSQSIEESPDALEEIEDRLSLIYGLKRKYGNSIEKVLSFYQAGTKELEELQNSTFVLDGLVKEKELAEKEINMLCVALTKIRKKAATAILKQIEDALKDLGMEKARFEVSFEQKTQPTPTGWDKVEFLLSANPGEALKPLAKIASGGEMSRVMLAIKSVIADADPIDTFIFDEIDAGVSGRTAQKVAEKMNLIARQKQILCITHLPQIASMADKHYLIEKRATKNKTSTFVREITKDESIEELARLIGGARITESTLIAANEMKEMADTLKEKR